MQGVAVCRLQHIEWSAPTDASTYTRKHSTTKRHVETSGTKHYGYCERCGPKEKGCFRNVAHYCFTIYSFTLLD